MSKLHAEILAIADEHDPFATRSATRRLLDYFPHSERQFVQLRPQNLGLPKLGHFGFFHDRFRNSLWPQSLHWLQTGKHSWARATHWPASDPS